MKLLRIAFSIVLVAFSPLHALSGAAQGALLSRENPGQGALWGAIGAAGGEVVLEAVYDPKARSEAIIADILKLKRQELSQLSKEQFSKSVQELLVKEMRADLERTRDLVRAGMSVTALAGGVDGTQMSMMDMTASRATEKNFFFQAIGIGLAMWETVQIVRESLDVCQKEGVGAALAHAGVETAKEVALAVTGVKAVKLAGKALKLVKASTVVGKVGEKIAGALPDAVGGLVPDAVKTTVQQAGTLVKKGAEAVGKLDRKLDTAVSTQVQKLRGRAAVGAGQHMPAPQGSAQCVYSKDVKGWKRPYKDSHHISAKDPNAQDFLKRKFKALEGAQNKAVEIRTLPDGRIRYHKRERASATPGLTRGDAFTTEHNPKTGQVRTWEEGRDHSGNVIRVHPKMIDGMTLDAPHYPPTKADHERFFKKPKQPTEPKGDS